MDRRSVLRGGALGAFLFQVGGAASWLTPAEARAAGASLKTLTAAEAATLEAFGEVLLPGARAAGIAHFIDSQISGDPEMSLLMLRYLDVPPTDHVGFYKASLAALDGYSRSSTGKAFAELSPDAAAKLVGTIAQAPPEGWRGPPSPLVYFAIRSDAVDVVYGTEAGFEKLGIPYMAHIEPPRPW